MHRAEKNNYAVEQLVTLLRAQEELTKDRAGVTENSTFFAGLDD